METIMKVEIDEKLLESIASKTGGLYFRATDNKKLKEIYQEINKLEKATLEKEVQELEGQELDTTKEQLGIAKAKIDALSSDFYQKI